MSTQNMLFSINLQGHVKYYVQTPIAFGLSSLWRNCLHLASHNQWCRAEHTQVQQVATCFSASDAFTHSEPVSLNEKS